MAKKKRKKIIIDIDPDEVKIRKGKKLPSKIHPDKTKVDRDQDYEKRYFEDWDEL